MSKRILLIDDEELITRTLARALEKAGYEVLVAKRGEDALIMAEEEEFDLIISDIRMPGPDGVETVKTILKSLQDRGDAKIPAIFMTGYANEEAEKRARDLQPAAYFQKPFDFPEFLAKVNEAISTKSHA